MSLTRKQIILCGMTWTKTSKAMLARESHLEKADLEAERQELLKLAGAKADSKGRYSAKTLSNRGVNTFLDLCETTISGKPNQKRRSKSLIYAIQKLGLPDDYLNAIARDQFQCADWQTLSESQLVKFRYTATTRARKKAKS